MTLLVGWQPCSMLHWMDYVLFCGVAGRLVLALAAVVHAKAIELVEVTGAVEKRAQQLAGVVGRRVPGQLDALQPVESLHQSKTQLLGLGHQARASAEVREEPPSVLPIWLCVYSYAHRRGARGQ